MAPIFHDLFKWKIYKMDEICFARTREKSDGAQNKRIYRTLDNRTQKLDVHPLPSSNRVSFSFSISMNCVNFEYVNYCVYSVLFVLHLEYARTTDNKLFNIGHTHSTQSHNIEYIYVEIFLSWSVDFVYNTMRI